MEADNHIVLCKLSKGSLYYYRGNFYYPLFGINSNDRNLIKVHTKRFKKDNKALIKKDKQSANYKNKIELFDEQEKEFMINE